MLHFQHALHVDTTNTRFLRIMLQSSIRLCYVSASAGLLPLSCVLVAWSNGQTKRSNCEFFVSVVLSLLIHLIDCIAINSKIVSVIAVFRLVDNLRPLLYLPSLTLYTVKSQTADGALMAVMTVNK